MTTEEYIKMQSEGMRNIYQSTGPVIEALFGVGDRVLLKSGGPEMTVCTHTDAEGFVGCIYFNDGKPETISVLQRCLKRVRWYSWIF